MSATSAASAASPDALSLTFEPFASGLEQPVQVTNAGDGSGLLYVVERSGRIRRVGPDGSVSKPFLDLTDRVMSDGIEQGLLGLAFHPRFEQNGRLFVDYTRKPDGATVISQFVVRDGHVNPARERMLLTVPQPGPVHNGGGLVFDDAGMLLIGIGDGGGQTFGLTSQDPQSLLGKLLRIDVDGEQPYGIPPDNGFAADADVLPEIHVMGLRNPWRFSIDPDGGHMYIGDVGAFYWEEIDVVPEGLGGQNFGWFETEGPQCSRFRMRCDPTAFATPAIAYPHDTDAAIVGGYVYRGEQQPLLDGIYVFGDWALGHVWGVPAEDLLAGSAVPIPLGTMPSGGLSSFGLDETGELYVTDMANGAVLRVVAQPR